MLDDLHPRMGAPDPQRDNRHASFRRLTKVSRPISDRILHEVRLQDAFMRLHKLGPRVVAEFCCELVEQSGADPAQLDRVLRWAALDPHIVRGDRFPSPLRVVPRNAEGDR